MSGSERGTDAAPEKSGAGEPPIFAASVAAEALLVVASRLMTRPQVADDYDSMNFLLGMSHYDLAKFQPQFPGYPVYVGLGHALCRLGLEPLTAAVLISSVASGIAALALAAIAWRLAGPRAAVAAGALQLVAWLPWLIGNSALSESLGVALALGSFALLLAWRPQPVWSGMAAGLTLGVRLSYWPIVLTLVVLGTMRAMRGKRAPLFAGLLLGLALWLVPFLAVVGPGELARLGHIHVAGHFQQWGGSVITRPNLWQRSSAFARDLFFDGLVPSAWGLAGIVTAAVTAAVLARARLRVLPWKPVLLVLAPYAVWAFFAQNILDQPRHVLPLVEGLLLLLAMLLAEVALARAAVYAVALAVSVPLAVRRHRTPPAAEQAAIWLAASQPFGDTLVAATRSARFFRDVAREQTRPGPQAGPTGDREPYQVREAPWLSGLIGELSRVDKFPAALWVTSEVDLHSGEGERAPLPAQWRIQDGPTFCRDFRIDNFQPCLTLKRLEWAPR